MMKICKLNIEVQKIVFEALEGSSYLDRHKNQLVEKIMLAITRETGLTKYAPDYMALYVDMCYKDMARIDGVNIEDYP